MDAPFDGYSLLSLCSCRILHVYRGVTCATRWKRKTSSFSFWKWRSSLPGFLLSHVWWCHRDSWCLQRKWVGFHCIWEPGKLLDTSNENNSFATQCKFLKFNKVQFSRKRDCWIKVLVNFRTAKICTYTHTYLQRSVEKSKCIKGSIINELANTSSFHLFTLFFWKILFGFFAQK